MPDCTEVIHELPLLPNNTVSQTFCAQIVSGANCQLDIHHWETG